MEAVLNWIKGIMGCLLLMSLVLQCVPGKIYRPYLRLFMGIILILTVLSPLTDLTGFGETLETMVGELAYQEAVPGWKEDLLKGEEWAEEQIIARAEEMSREAEEQVIAREEMSREAEEEQKEQAGKVIGEAGGNQSEKDKNGAAEGLEQRTQETERGQQNESAVYQIQVEVGIEQVQPVVISGGGQDEDT